MALDNLRGGTKRVVEENTPLNNLRGGTKRVVIVDGGGGSVDYAKTVQRAETMPTADSSNAGQQFLYSGESDATYTHGYIYENVATTTSSSASATQTVGSTLSDIAVDLATLESFTGWTTDNSLQIFYTADGWSVDTTSLGVTYTGTPNVGDAITITYTAESTSYAWTQIDVQPSASYSAGTGIYITSGVISVITPVTSTGSGGLVAGNGYSTTDTQQWITRFGRGTQATGAGSSAFGNSARARGDWSIALGGSAEAYANYAIQLGMGTNSTANTFKVGLSNNSNYELLSSNGTVPTARLTKVNTTATLAVADWSSNTQTVTVSGVTATSVVFVSPAPASASDYASAGILCTAQAANSLTFTCTTTPTNAITVNVICF